MDTQTKVNAAASLRELARNDREFEAAVKETTVSSERIGYSRPSPPKSTPVFVQHGPAAREIDITGNHMLLALAVVLAWRGRSHGRL